MDGRRGEGAGVTPRQGFMFQGGQSFARWKELMGGGEVAVRVARVCLILLNPILKSH